MDKEQQFMKSPLVSWVRTFDDTINSLKDLADGVIFNKIMHEVDPSTYGLSRVAQAVCDEPSLRLQNLQLAVNCIKHFYMVSQKQLVIAPLPEVSEIAHDPVGDKSLDELEKLIILLLGCTIHSEHNNKLIANITKKMEPEHQHTLVFYIQKITDSTEFVCNFDWTDFTEIPKLDLEALCRTAYVYLQRVAKERDYLFDTLSETIQERDFYKDQQTRPTVSPLTPNISPQINPELIELKKQARALHEDIERKNDIIAEQEDDLKQTKLDLQKLQHEKLELLEDAKAAQAYRDELEALKVQSSKVEQLEHDVMKYRQKAEDADYLKKRVGELKQQNELMSETKSLLEQKVSALSTRADMVDDLQVEIASLKAQMESLNQEKQMDMERIEDLVAQNARYELESKNNQEQIIQLTTELKTERERIAESASSASSETSLSFEISETNLAQRAKLMRLEKENREMEKEIETARHVQAKVSELEKTNKKLYTQSHSDKKEIIKLREEVEVLKVKSSRVDKLQTELSSQRDKLEEANRLQSRLKEMKTRNESIMEAKVTLEDQLEDLQGKLDTLDMIQKENAQLKAQVDALNMESTEDQKRIQELMEQNAQLDLENQRFNKRVSDLAMELDQKENRSANSPAGKLTVINSPSRSEADIASKAKIQRLEKELAEYEKTKESLRHYQAKVTELEKTTKKQNKQAHTDKREIIRLKEEVELLKTKTSRLERRRSVKMSMSGSMEEIDTARGKVAELKQQNTLIQESKALLEEEVNSLRSKLSNLGELQSENAVLKVRLNSLEQESQEESQRMQDLLQENAQLELQRERDLSDIETLKKELDNLRTAASKKKGGEVPFSPVGQLLTDSELATRAKLLRMERDHHELQSDYDLFKKRSERAASELENTNKKLNTQIHNDRKEIVRLKETLKHEKEISGKLTNQVNHLQKMVAHSTNSTDGQSEVGGMASEQKMIRELGSKIDEAHSQSLAIKEERIGQLEKRVEELRQENGSLKEQLLGTTGLVNGNSRFAESRLKEKNALLSAQVTDSGHLIDQLKQRNENLQDRLEMFEQLNNTLEEEKKTLLMQVNKLLEQNQGLLMRTLETKDHELEEERVFSDRLSELEREKTLLAERLKTQEKEALVKEMEILKQRERKKNPLKRTMKKIKGKFNKGRTFKFEDDHGLVQPDHSQSSSSFSPRTSTYLLPGGDGSPRSSNQSLSSNSRHSDSYDEIEGGGSAPDVNSAGYIPRPPTMISATPVTLRQRKTQSLFIPPTSRFARAVGSPSMIDDGADVISLQDFLDERNRTPNRRKMMEIKRASIITTPDITPRNSMLFGINQVPTHAQLPDQLELQDFLKKFQQNDETMSIPEVEDEEEQQYKTDEEEGQEEEHVRGSITPNEASMITAKTFNLNPNSNTNNNNGNNNYYFNGGITDDGDLERLSPLLGAVAASLSSSAVKVVHSPEENENSYTESTQDGVSDISQSSEPPFMMTYPALYPPPRSPSMEDFLDVGPRVEGSSTGKKLKKRKLYGSFADLTSSVKHSALRGKAFHKSTDTLSDKSLLGGAGLEKINEESSRFRFRAVSLSLLNKFSISPEKESREKPGKTKQKRFGGHKKSERPLSMGTISSSQLVQPPSVKNKVSSSTGPEGLSGTHAK